MINTNRNKIYVALVIALAVALSACSNSGASGSVPSAPVSAQQTVLQTNKLLSDTANTLVHAVAALHQQGKLDDGTAHTLDQYAIQIAQATQGVQNILSNGQPWTTQKPQLINYLATVTAPNIAGQIDPSIQGTVASLGNLLTQILQQVQGGN